jgi:hypothetical protein
MEETLLLLRFSTAESEADGQVYESLDREVEAESQTWDPAFVAEVLAGLSETLNKVVTHYASDSILRDRMLQKLRQGRARDPKVLAGALCGLFANRLKAISAARKIVRKLSPSEHIPGEESLEMVEAQYAQWLGAAKELLADVSDDQLQDTILKAFRKATTEPRQTTDWRREIFGDGEEPAAHAV